MPILANVEACLLTQLERRAISEITAPHNNIAFLLRLLPIHDISATLSQPSPPIHHGSKPKRTGKQLT
jgi:hypothetical protein